MERVAEGEMGCKISIPEVFEFRKNNIGDVETICSLLAFEVKRRHYEEIKSDSTSEIQIPFSYPHELKPVLPIEGNDEVDHGQSCNSEETQSCNQNKNQADENAFGDTVDSRLFGNDLSTKRQISDKSLSNNSFVMDSTEVSDPVKISQMTDTACDNIENNEPLHSPNNNVKSSYVTSTNSTDEINVISLEPNKHLTFTKLSFEDCMNLNNSINSSHVSESKSVILPENVELNWLEAFDKRPQIIRQMEQQHIVDNQRYPYMRIPKDVYNDSYFPRVKAKSKTRLA